MKSINEDEYVYWSPTVHWEKKDDAIIIGNLAYKGIAFELFPEIYNKTSDGIKYQELLLLECSDKRKLEKLIINFIKQKILVSDLLSMNDLFAVQGLLYKSPYSEDILYDPAQYEKFKMEQMTRQVAEKEDQILLKHREYPEFIAKRKTTREFSKDKLTVDELGQLLSIFRQIQEDNHPSYYYASAGGLYPVDIYLNIKQNAVVNMAGGIYKYNPYYNSIGKISNAVISSEVYYQSNKEIYDASLISLFFIYNGNVNMPKYKGNGCFYGCIDCGIMIGTLTQVVELMNLGMCSIGAMDFEKIENLFMLQKSCYFLQAVEIGKKE